MRLGQHVAQIEGAVAGRPTTIVGIRPAGAAWEILLAIEGLGGAWQPLSNIAPRDGFSTSR